MPRKLTHEEYVARVRDKYGDQLIVLDRYVNASTSIRHKCTNCGDIKARHPNITVTRPGSRLYCCYQLPKTEVYAAELEKLGSTLRPAEPYKGRLRKSLHRCLVCNSERVMTPAHIIKGHGCFVCAKEKQRHGYFTRKSFTIRGKTYSLQGFEPQALQYMVDHGANPEYLISEVSEGKPTIPYRYGGKTKLFIPDFFHSSKNRIVEVKSWWTLGLSSQLDGGPFKQNATKAKAAKAAGYEFLLLLFDRAGNRLPLPRNWYEMTKRQVICEVRSTTPTLKI